MILPCFMIFRVFHDLLVSLNLKGFDPQIFLHELQNIFFYMNPKICCLPSLIHMEGLIVTPINRKWRENPAFSNN